MRGLRNLDLLRLPRGMLRRRILKELLAWEQQDSSDQYHAALTISLGLLIRQPENAIG